MGSGELPDYEWRDEGTGVWESWKRGVWAVIFLALGAGVCVAGAEVLGRLGQ